MANYSAIQAFDDDPSVEVARDQDVVCGLDHLQQPWSPSAPLSTAAFGEEGQPTAQGVAHQYLVDTSDAYGIPKSLLKEASADLVEGQGLRDTPPALKLVEERPRHKSTAVSYQQTLLGLPVWNAKFSVTLNEKLQVINSISSIKPDATAPRKPQDDAKYLNEVGADDLREVLGFRPGEGQITINKQGLLVYLYDKNSRQLLDGEHGEAGSGDHGIPTLILNEVPDSIQNGRYYVVREVLFTFPLSGYGNLNWRAFVEVETGTVLYLRALTSGVGRPAYGWVFTVDPTTRLGSAAPQTTGDIAKLNILRERTLLPDITPTSPQALKGNFAEIKDIEAPNIKPQSSSTGEFDYSVESDGFAAVNAYHHIAKLFRLVEDLGFSVSTLFNNTTFPVPVDHRGFNNESNAQAPSNGTGDGSGGFIFGRASNDANSTVGISADFRIAAHEFGHALLWDAVRSANFGFAHSAGDALGAIYCDPGSKAPDRFDTFPWSWVRRSHGRDVADGWAWDGPRNQADKQYLSEQVLSTSLFRIYRAIGGDAIDDLQRQTWASRYTLYLILGGIASLTTKNRRPEQYVSFLMYADNGTILGYPGGAVRKIIRWAFEKQGLYQRPGTPLPVFERGAPPLVDVFINDGRSGEYDYQADFEDAPGIWNRHTADGGRVNQTPIVGVPNYIYVTVQNRGLQAAQEIQVRAYVSKVIHAQKWDIDAVNAEFEEVNLSSPSNIGSIPAGGSVDVGPFEWTPDRRFVRHSLLASVSAKDDLSNIDLESGLDCSKGPIDLDKLVPFDNNLALRTV